MNNKTTFPINYLIKQQNAAQRVRQKKNPHQKNLKKPTLKLQIFWTVFWSFHKRTVNRIPHYKFQF